MGFTDDELRNTQMLTVRANDSDFFGSLIRECVRKSVTNRQDTQIWVWMLAYFIFYEGKRFIEDSSLLKLLVSEGKLCQKDECKRIMVIHLEKGLSYNQLSIIISYSLQISAFNKVFLVILVFGAFALMSLK